MSRRACSAVGMGLFLAAAMAYAQKDTEADPMHHKLEFENDCVRVVRANFGPGEKAAAPFDAQGVVFVSLTGGEPMRIHFPDGTSILGKGTRPGEVGWFPPGRLQPENTSSARIEFIVIEPKGCK